LPVRFVSLGAFETGLLVIPLLSRAILHQFFGARAGGTAEGRDILESAAGLDEILPVGVGALKAQVAGGSAAVRCER
jgi:hypothetical protein